MDIELQHEKFAREYILCLNASKAAEKSGYKASYAKRLIQKPSVRSAIRRLQLEIRSRWHGHIDEVMSTLTSVASASLKDFLETDPTTGRAVLKDLSEIPTDKLKTLTNLKVDEDGHVRSIQFNDKLRAIEGVMTRMGIDGRDPTLDASDLNDLLRQEYLQVSELRLELQMEKEALRKERHKQQKEHQEAMVKLDREKTKSTVH